MSWNKTGKDAVASKVLIQTKSGKNAPPLALALNGGISEDGIVSHDSDMLDSTESLRLLLPQDYRRAIESL